MRRTVALCSLILLLCAPRIYGVGGVECPDQSIIRKAESLLESDPVEMVKILRDAADCDEKFALLYYADVRIARNAHEGFFYNDKINPRGRYEKKPNQYEQEIIQNPERFISAAEGFYSISVGDYWVKRINDPDHPAIGTFKLRGIRRFDTAVWEDGDGTMHSPKLIRDYEKWIRTFPDHEQVATVRKRIKELRQFTRRPNNRVEQPG